MTRTIIDCIDWVKNDHHLQGWYQTERRATGCTLRQFAMDNRAEIDHAIDSLIASNGHYAGDMLGVI